MKKLFFFASGLLICCVLLICQQKLFSVSAQNKTDEKSGNTSFSAFRNGDKELAESIKKMTRRSSEELKTKNTGSGVTVDLEGRFQNVMLSKIETDGEPAAACVASLEEANSFLERNLETGEYVPSFQFQKDYAPDFAARHGMSEGEFEFFRKMIDDAVKRKAAYPESEKITIVNNDAAGEGFNDATAKSAEGGNTAATLGGQRLKLFNFAADIWGAFLDTNVQIKVSARFDPLTPCSSSGGVLGAAGAMTVARDFANAEFPETWYHIALANKRAGRDLNGSASEIDTVFNSAVDNGCLGSVTRFYYGLDNSTPSGTVNLLVVVLHELGHGLGFSSFIEGSNGALMGGYPDIYTRYMYDLTANKHWHQMTDAERRISAVNAGNVFWDGLNVRADSNFLVAGSDAATGRVQLFTPNSFQGGSSVSHFSTAATENLLMEPAINRNLPLNLDLTRQQMRDIGWFRDRNGDGLPDTITDVIPHSNPLVRNAQATVFWTNSNGFDDNVTIELSLDGGATYPTVIASNVENTGSYTFIAPDVTTSQAKIRVREHGFMSPTGASSNFHIQFTPTAASATISGRVLDGKGRPISRAMVSLTDLNGVQRAARANHSGYFRFEGVAAGANYVLTAEAKGYVFEPKFVGVNQDAVEQNLFAVNNRR
jgi:hypothetical protein